MSENKSEKPARKKPINGAKKGKAFEREVANALGHIFPDAERMLEYQASGVVGVDLQNTGEFDIQCKRNANYCPIGKINEIRVNDPNRTPVLVTRGNKMPAMCVLPFEKFIGLLERIPGMVERQTIASEKLPDVNTSAKQIEDNTSLIEVSWSEDGNVETNSIKNEKDLADALSRLSSYLKVPATYLEGMPPNRIKAILNNGTSAYFHCNWDEPAGPGQAMQSIVEYIAQYEDNKARLVEVNVRPPENSYEMPGYLTEPEEVGTPPESAPVEESAPQPETYSFL